MNIQNTINVRGNSIEKTSRYGFMLFLLLLFFNKATIGQTYDWKTGGSPAKHVVKMYDGLKEIKVEVKMQYYIPKGIDKYYRKDNNKNKKFGEDFTINETSVFKVKIELRSLKNSADVVLVIPGSGYVTTTGCFTKPKEDLKQPLKVYLNGDTELTFGIKPNYDGTSKINIDLEFEKNGKPLKKKLAGRKKQKKTTSVIIPIKTGLSKGKKDAIDKEWLDSHLEGMKNNQIINQIDELIHIYGQQVPQNRKDLLTKAIRAKVDKHFKSTFKDVETPCTLNLLNEYETTDSYKFLSKKYKTEFATIKKNCSNNKELKEAKEWLANEISLIQVPGDILGEIEQVKKLLNKEDINDLKKSLLKKEIKKRVTTYFTKNVLKTDCKVGSVQRFGNSDNFKYLSEEDQQKYHDFIKTCNANVASEKDRIAYNSAKNDNTVKAYENYKKLFSNGAYLSDADKQIRKLKNADNNAWSAAQEKAKNSSDYCEQAEAFEAYLKNAKNKIYRNSAKEKRDLASSKCQEFRIEKVSEDVEKGEYTFEIKNGTAPFTYSIVGNEDLTETNKSEFTIKILEGEKYEILVEGTSNSEEQSYTYNLEAENPKFELIMSTEDIKIKGGEGPFKFETDDGQKKQYVLEGGRSIMKQDLLKELGMEGKVFNFLTRDAKERNTKSYNIEDDGGGEGSNWLMYLIIASVITLLLYVPRHKWFLLSQKILRKEDKFWKRAIVSKSLDYLKNYEEKYPKGKYIDALPQIKEELRVWHKSIEAKNFDDYAKTFSEGVFKKEAEEKKKEIIFWKQCEKNNTYKDYQEKYPQGMFINQMLEEHEKNKVKEAKKRGKTSPTPIDIDFLNDNKNEESPIEFTSEPLALSPEKYFKFDLNKHWEDSCVQTVWMSKEACRKAYLLIDDAKRAVLEQGREGKPIIPEVGGFLIGYAKKVNEGYFEVQVEEFVSVTPENNGEYEITFGRTAFLELDEAYTNNPGLELMGWMHTHPGHSLFLSEKDKEVIEAFFKEPFHISMEVETKTKNLDTAFFTRKKDSTLNNTQNDKKEVDWFHWDDVNLWLIQ